METTEDRFLKASVKRLINWYKCKRLAVLVELECRIIVKWIAVKYGSKFVKDIADEVLDRTLDEF
jgi:hypothetical protein